MSNITAYPLQDGFETTLAQSWNGATGTVYLNTAPSFTFPVGVKTYIVVNPGKTNMQVGEIDSLNVGAKTVNVSSISIGSGAGTTYTQESHSVGSTVIISDNYQFWKNIIDAVNSKIDGLVQGIYFYADSTARDADLGASPSTSGLIAGLTTEGKITYSLAGSWMDWSTTSSTFVNASETVAGKVEEATQAEFDAGTKVGGTGADLYPTPDKIQKMVNTATAKTAMVDADQLLLADSAAANINKKITFQNFLQLINGFGDGSDGDVTISSGTTTLTRDMYYNNLTIANGATLIPDGYRIFVRGTLTNNGTISRPGNAGGAGANGSGTTDNTAGGTAGAAVNAGTLGTATAGQVGGVGRANNQAGTAGTAGTSNNPSYTNVNGAAAGAGGTGAGGGNAGGAAGAGGTSTRGSLYNIAYNPKRIFYLLAGPASFPFLQTSQYTGVSGGGSGGGGAGGGNGAGGGGGGSGSNGGLIWICANTFNNTSGTVSAIGGAGGAGGNAAATTNPGGGGGGAGGSGGTFVLIYSTLTSIGTVTLTGGAGGAGGAKFGTGTAGAAGATGATGQTISIAV